MSVAADLLGEIDTNSHEYKSSVKELGKDERKDRLSKIQELFQKAREYSDDKVQIAMQMYEMVRHVHVRVHLAVVCVLNGCHSTQPHKLALTSPRPVPKPYLSEEKHTLQ